MEPYLLKKSVPTNICNNHIKKSTPPPAKNDASAHRILYDRDFRAILLAGAGAH